MSQQRIAYQQSDVELEWAKHFMRWVTMCDPSRILKLDIDKRRRRPDFAFYYATGRRYTLEVERWLTPELRQLQNQAEENLSEPLQNRLKGTFILDVPFNEFKGGQIPRDEARTIVTEIQRAMDPGTGSKTHLLSRGRVLKVSDDGGMLHPMVMRPELPLYLDESDQEVRALREKLEEILLKTEEKFRRYRGSKVLLLDISQCGLDIDYHASVSKEGRGIVCRWLEELLKPSARIDYVCVGQGMRLWSGGSGHRILSGHKYEDKPAPDYAEVWRRPGLPYILSSLAHPGSA